MGRREHDSIVVRCTVSKDTHPRLYRALSDVPALDRTEWIRHHAAIGHALASNQSVLELLAIAVSEQATAAHGKSPVCDAAPASSTGGGTDLPADDYLDHLADTVLSRA